VLYPFHEYLRVHQQIVVSKTSAVREKVVVVLPMSKGDLNIDTTPPAIIKSASPALMACLCGTAVSVHSRTAEFSGSSTRQGLI